MCQDLWEFYTILAWLADYLAFRLGPCASCPHAHLHQQYLCTAFSFSCCLICPIDMGGSSCTDLHAPEKQHSCFHHGRWKRPERLIPKSFSSSFSFSHKPSPSTNMEGDRCDSEVKGSRRTKVPKPVSCCWPALTSGPATSIGAAFSAGVLQKPSASQWRQTRDNLLLEQYSSGPTTIQQMSERLFLLYIYIL